MKKFQHGGDIKSFAKDLDCDEKDIIDLSSNINFLKPKINIDFNTLDINAYPKYDKLYKTISKHYNVKKENIELFNGGSSAIFNLFNHLELKTCTIYSPAYLEYKKAAKIFEYKIQKINRFKDIKENVKKNSLVIFVNPSTPDGKYYDIKKLIDHWIKQDCTILIDESFLEFTNKESTIKYLKDYDKLYILKSMTKFYSSAGIRIGTLISSKKNIENLRQKEPLWKISTFDMNYLLEALRDKKFQIHTRNVNIKNKKTLIKILKEYSFIEKIYESEANYLLVKLKIEANNLQKHLKEYKIMIRDCSNFDFLNKYFARIAIKDKKSINKLKEALDRI